MSRGRRIWAGVVCIGALLALAGTPVRADGYVVPGPEVSSSVMADQKAAIVWAGGHEELILSIGLDVEVGPGNQELAWVIPVPTPPEVEAVSEALFEELDRIAAPEIVYRQERQGWGPGLSLGAEAGPPPVEILERKQVGAYDVAVLAGREAGGVLDWLQAEGFGLPPGLEGPLAAYIAEGWTFVAVRLAPEATQGAIVEAQPIWLSFDAEEMIYPMRLTAAQGRPLALRLYILAEHRYDLEGFSVEFAGRATVPAVDPALNAVLGREFFLTKLFDGEVTPAEMAGDFYPRQAASDDPYREQQVYTYVSAGGGGLGSGELLCLCGLCWLGLLLLLALVVAALLLLRRRRKRSLAVDAGSVLPPSEP